MLTIDDVEKIEISLSCLERWPCGHRTKLTLKDGRSCTHINSYQTWSIVSQLAAERINPERDANDGWDAAEVREHFQKYSVSRRGWQVETAEVVLGKLFAK